MATNKTASIPQIGREYPPANENEIVSDMIRLTRKQLETLYAGKEMLRQVHAKMHGCVKAEFTVEPNLPAEFRVGVFKEPKSYPAWARFSNGKTQVLHDKGKDTRGFAIKLMDVPGEKVLESQRNAKTHDFIFASSPIFFAKGLKDFDGLLKASVSTNKLAVPAFLILNPRNWRMAFRTLFKLLIVCKNPLAIPYFSATPYQFGDETRAVKYLVRPSDKNVLEYTDDSDFDYLRKSMAATLKKHDIYFDFCIQFQTDAVKMPIENAIVEWKSPFTKVATIKIPAQVFDTDTRNQFGEDLTFNAWHCLPEHRPLGGFNRGRRRIYEELYTYRHAHNDVPLFEPEPGNDFFTNMNTE